METSTLKPIIEIRAVKYTWYEHAHDAPPGAIQVVTIIDHGIEIRREGETEWTKIPVIEVKGKPK